MQKPVTTQNTINPAVRRPENGQRQTAGKIETERPRRARSRFWRKPAALFCALLTGAFCLLPGASAQAAQASAYLSAALEDNTGGGQSGSAENSENTGVIHELNVFLPTDMPALQEILTEAAAAEGVSLQIQQAVPGEQYVAELSAAEAGGKRYDICWIEGEVAARELYDNGVSMMDLSADAVGTLMQSLAGLTPAYARLLNEDAVYGLPVGAYAGGTLVNISTLAALLSAKDAAALVRDLMNCTYTEWQTLVAAIESYLARPEKIGVTLGGHSYSFPVYRPEAAKDLKGIFAAPGSAHETTYESEISAILSSVFESPAQFAATPASDRKELLSQPLLTLLGAIDFETMHRANKNGKLIRNSGISAEKTISAEEAEQLFVNGQALFMRGDTMQGLKYEQDYPNLQGKLAIIPTKLPFSNAEAQQLNYRLSVGTAGVLGVNLHANAYETAIRVLTRLFTSTNSRKNIEKMMYLQTYTDYYPSNMLIRQIVETTNDEKYYLAVQPLRLMKKQSKSLSGWVNENLMQTETWGDTEGTKFTIAAQNIVGAS